MVFRILVEKKEPHNVEAKKILGELKHHFDFKWLKNLRIINRYDVEGIGEEIFEKAKNTVFSEPTADVILDALPPGDDNIIFAVESLPGQYDQRADSCSQCLQILTEGIRPMVRCAKIYVLETDPAGDNMPDESDFNKIRNYIINPVESHEVSLDEYGTLEQEYDMPDTVETIGGFINLDAGGLETFLKDYSLAMDLDDILFCQDYFKNTEKRDPTITEIRMIDTYWSDHCRHTTFLTEITGVEIEDLTVKNAFVNYLSLRQEVYGKNNPRRMTLMDIATIGAKYLKKQGRLINLDESEEVNACSVNIKVNIDGRLEDYLLMFKNETHNHPTQIEPFGGAATALGGAIRDILAGRAYCYQGMRVTGSADPRQKIEDTLKDRLPQFKITRGAADGFSSYGNQIGAATGAVYEIYHPGYAAKRMELGAVIGAVPRINVRRMTPVPGDAIILLGGKTGRDGCGGATSSSKSQSKDSLKTSGAEVQKGDPLEEHKIQRLFRNPRVAAMIKRCNDFGAGGVSVAIGELADSIFIDLSLVPVKYPGLDGTEIAISESQERMAVVVAAENVNAFIREAESENLGATKVAVVADDNKLRMIWNGNQIVSVDRRFLNSNGAGKKTQIKIPDKNPEYIRDILSILYQKIKSDDIKQAYMDLISDLNICSLKGLSEQFDSSIGGRTVISPFGGENRLTPAQFMAAKIPVLNGNTNTASVMAYGFSPYVSEISPYRGAMYAVVESVSKIIAAGVNLADIYLSFQEYFPRADSPERFGLPFEALLGALEAQVSLGIAAIGGKDSMSGSYSYEETDDLTGEKSNKNIDVPPALISFAVGTANADKIISHEFKSTSSYVYLLKPYYKHDGSIDFNDLKNLYGYVNKLIRNNMLLSSYAVGFGGVGEAVFKMCAGNGIGFSFDNSVSQRDLFSSSYGAFIVESNALLKHGELIGRTNASPNIFVNNTAIDINDMIHRWLSPLEEVFPTGLGGISEETQAEVPKINYYLRPQAAPRHSPPVYQAYQPAQPVNPVNFARPRVFIPVFPGTNGESDMAKQFNDAGGLIDISVFRNLNAQMISESINMLAHRINNCQILAIPGGFSGGSEPDGAGKFIAALFRLPKITEAVRNLLFYKQGLIFGAGDGFRALVKLGLLPYGDIKEVMDEDDPAISFNLIGRHQSYMAYTRVASVNSPWFSGVRVGDTHAIPVSTAEGRLILTDEKLNSLIQNGQVATQYCDVNGNPTMDPYYNPGGSVCAIEGLFSPDGRIFGKMGHNERNGRNVMINVPGNKNQLIFTSGVGYFR